MEMGIKSPCGTHAGLGLSVDRAFGDQRKKPDCLSRKETVEFAVSVSYIQISSFRWACWNMPIILTIGRLRQGIMNLRPAWDEK